MALPLLAPIIGGLGNLIGGIFGMSQAQQAQRLRELQSAKIQGIEIPGINEQMLALEKLQRGEQLQPEEMQAASVADSAFEDVSSDPRLKQAQMDALAGLQDVSSSGGMQLQDKANLQKLMTQTASADKGRRDAIRQNMAERGMAGSGMELAQSLGSAQDAATLENQGATDIAGQAQARALQALQMGGQLGGQIRGQDFDQQARAAEARDAIAKFNAANQQQASQFNTGNKMNTNIYNTDRANQVSDQNVGLSNQQQAYNKGLYQTQFENQMNKQKLASDATKEQASGAINFGNQVSGVVGNLGQAIGQLGAPRKKVE